MDDYRGRLDAVQAGMAENDLDLLVLGAGPNVQYLTDADIDWRYFREHVDPATALFVPADGEPIATAGHGAPAVDRPADVRRVGLFEDFTPAVVEVLDELADDTDRIGVDRYAAGVLIAAVSSHRRGATLVSATGALNGPRAVKSADDVERLRRVAELTDEVMHTVIDGLAAGDTMRDIELRMERVGREAGATPGFPSFAGFTRSGGAATDELVNYDPDQGLETGTSIAFDVGFVVDGVCSDWGRSVYYGDPPAHIDAAYSALRRAVVETVEAIGDRIHRVDEIFPHIEAVCDREGYGEQLRTRHPDGVVGHQIGIEVHEDPWLRPANTDDLVDGMVFCIEPKLWNKGEYYLRIEDMVHVTDGTAEFLTRYDRDRFVL